MRMTSQVPALCLSALRPSVSLHQCICHSWRVCNAILTLLYYDMLSIHEQLFAVVENCVLLSDLPCPDLEAIGIVPRVWGGHGEHLSVLLT